MRHSFLFLAAGFLVLPFPRVHAQNDKPAMSTQTLPEGISLPKTGTVYALDTKDKNAELVQLHASEIVSNSHAAGNLARSMVYAGAHASVELKGLNAAVEVKDAHTSFLVRLNSDDPEVTRSRVHLIRMDQTKDRRVVSSFSQNVFGGQRAKKYNDIAILKKDVDPDVWLEITPLSPLGPGEYGVVFMPADAAYSPDVVYDFDVSIGSAVPVKN